MTTYDQDRIEGQRRAQWLHDHNAPHNWLILTSGEIAVLKAAIPLWHAIDTAPRDSTDILVWAKHHPVMAAFWSESGYWKGADDSRLEYSPSHWMPLPTPPTTP